MSDSDKQLRPLSELSVWERNYNEGDIGAISISIATFGYNRSIAVWRDGIVIAGNHTLLALQWLYKQQADVPQNVEVIDSEWWVQVSDASHLSEQEATAYAIADNRTSALANPNMEQLTTLLQEVARHDDALFAASGYTNDDLDEILRELNPPEEAPGNADAVLNRAEELRDKYQVERGQVWQIGRHRLMCGDAYDPDNIELLLDGNTPDLLHTDPPYGINIVQPRKNGSTADSGGAKSFGSTADTQRKGKAAIVFRGHVQHGELSRNQIIQSNLYPIIEGDDRPFDPAFLLDFAPITVLWGANYYADKLPISSGWVVWDKRENITRNNFADCEMAWTNQDKPARIFYHLWNGLHKGSQHGERRIHPTEKPVALFEEIGKMLCPAGLWLDLFAGSGAQIVAAERNGATCFALEYEPLYVASVIERMSDMGLEPTLAQEYQAAGD